MRMRLCCGLLLLLLGLTGRVSALDDYPSAIAGGPADLSGELRVINLLPATPLSLYLDNSRLLAAVPADSATRYLTVMARSYQAVVRPAGAGLAGDVLAQQSIRLAPRFFDTLIIYGAPGAMRLALLADNPTETARGMVRVRLFNAVPDTVPFTLSFAGKSVTTGAACGQATPYQLVNAAAPITVTAAGSGTLVATLPSLPGAVRVFTIVTYRLPQDAAVRTLVLAERMI